MTKCRHCLHAIRSACPWFPSVKMGHDLEAMEPRCHAQAKSPSPEIRHLITRNYSDGVAGLQHPPSQSTDSSLHHHNTGGGIGFNAFDAKHQRVSAQPSSPLPTCPNCRIGGTNDQTNVPDPDPWGRHFQPEAEPGPEALVPKGKVLAVVLFHSEASHWLLLFSDWF